MSIIHYNTERMAPVLQYLYAIENHMDKIVQERGNDVQGSKCILGLPYGVLDTPK